MKKTITFLLALTIVLSVALPVYAAESKVHYDGNAKQFIFEPGSEYSLTDLFTDFKDVMPGDTLSQKITVKNDAADNVKVKVYIRSLGAHEDSEDFLSQLRLKVQKSDENEMAYMFDAAADETAQLSDWVYLGMLYSGGEVNLDVILEVPVELDNEFQSQIGYLDWEFMVEEFPIEGSDPQVPPVVTPPVFSPTTGDTSRPGLWLALMAGALIGIVVLLIWRRKRQK